MVKKRLGNPNQQAVLSRHDVSKNMSLLFIDGRGSIRDGAKRINRDSKLRDNVIQVVAILLAFVFSDNEQTAAISDEIMHGLDFGRG